MSEIFRQIELDCDCGNHLSATVLSFDPFDLACNKCKKHFVEGIDQVWGIKDHIVTQWIQL